MADRPGLAVNEFPPISKDLAAATAAETVTGSNVPMQASITIVHAH
jgi:hypothetical protein